MDPLLGVALVAIAASLGWAIRGEWGSWWGETVPGAFAGTALWLAFGESTNAWQMIAYGATLSIAHTVGGDISYGQVVSYVASRSSVFDRSPTGPLNRSPVYGLLALFLIGGLIGFFPGVALGFLLSQPSFTLGDISLWAALGTSGALLFHRLVVQGLGFRLSPPRYDFWAPVLGASLATIGFFSLRDLLVLRAALLAWLGYGFGFAVGGLIHRRALRLNWRLDSWKLMEHSVGLFGGLALAWSVILVGKAPEVPLAQAARALSFLIVCWFVPYLVLTDVVQDWTFLEWLPGTMKTRRTSFETGIRSSGGKDGWRRVMQRPAFAASQMLALGWLVAFGALAWHLSSSWKGIAWGSVVFAVCISANTLIGILKFLPTQRMRRKLITQATFVLMAAFCIIVAIAQP